MKTGHSHQQSGAGRQKVDAVVIAGAKRLYVTLSRWLGENVGKGYTYIVSIRIIWRSMM